MSPVPPHMIDFLNKEKLERAKQQEKRLFLELPPEYFEIEQKEIQEEEVVVRLPLRE